MAEKHSGKADPGAERVCISREKISLDCFERACSPRH